MCLNDQLLESGYSVMLNVNASPIYCHSVNEMIFFI